MLLWPVFRPVWPGLLAGTVLLLALFAPEAGAAVHVWDTSTAYGHCWLVLPLALWLGWDRRYAILAARARPWPVIGLLTLPLAALWLAAYLLGIMEGRQLAALGCFEVLVLAVTGPALWGRMAAALAYLLFLVPFGAFLTPYLQQITAHFVGAGMDLLGVPGRVTQFRIEIPEGGFYVAEACAGLRFLIASIAFGVLYAFTMFQSPWRRVIYIGIAIIVPVVANGLRALGIVLLGHALGSAQAAATDHVLYGWIFFSLVILLLALAGMPFREDLPPAPPLAPPPSTPPAPPAYRAALLAALPVCAIAATGPLAAALLGGHAGVPDARPVLITPPGCILNAVSPQGPVLLQTYSCGGWHVAARLTILPRGANPARITEAGIGQAVLMAGGGDLDGGVLDVPETNPQTWLLQRDREGARGAAATLLLDGAPALGGLHDRMRLTTDLLHGTGTPSIALVVAVHAEKGDPEAALHDFLAAQGDLTRRMVSLLPAR